MTDAEAAALYRLLIVAPLLVALVVASALSVAHVLALHGRRLLPALPVSIAGWLTFGLIVGLMTQFLSTEIAVWAFAGAIAAVILHWAWREGRLPDAGIAMAGGALPWLLSVGLFMVLVPSDPTIPVVDVRFLIVVTALLTIGSGTGLILGAPRTRRERPMNGLERALVLNKAIDRAQAMGPVSAPMVLTFLAALAASIAALVLAWDLAPGQRSAISGASFVAAGIATWLVATPRRVRDAQAAISWLVAAERRMWAERLRRGLPRTRSGATRLLASMPEGPVVRPLRIELLAAFGRLDEARAELRRLSVDTDEERAVEAECAEYVAWCGGDPDETGIDRLAAAIPGIEDPATRLRLQVSLAVSRARRAAARRDPGAIDHLVAVRKLLGDARPRPAPGSALTVLVIVAIGIFIIAIPPASNVP